MLEQGVLGGGGRGARQTLLCLSSLQGSRGAGPALLWRREPRPGVEIPSSLATFVMLSN